MGDRATTPDESHRAESCFAAVESGNQQEQTEPSEWQPGSPTHSFHIYRAYVARAAGFVHAHSGKLVSVYKIKHICGST